MEHMKWEGSAKSRTCSRVRRSQNLVFHSEEGALARGHDSKSDVQTYLEGTSVKIAVGWLKRRTNPNWADKRKHGISESHGIAACLGASMRAGVW